MRFEDERYVRVYTRDTVAWLAMRWESRVVLLALFRKVDRAGLLELGEDGIEGLCVALALPLEVVSPGLDGLVKRGTVRMAGTTLAIPNFITAQEARQSDRARQQAARERARDLVRDVTPRSESSRHVTETAYSVTPSHAASHAVTPSCAVLSHTVPSQEEIQESAADAAAAPAAPVVVSIRKVARYTAAVHEVFEHWASLRKARKPKGGTLVLGQKRAAKIRARLSEGFSVEDLKRACEGVWQSSYHTGGNDRGEDYTDIVTCLRDDAQVSKFMALAASAPPDPNRPGFIDGLPILRLPDRDKHIPKPGEGIDATGLFPAEEA